MIRDNKADIVCLQESKREIINMVFCESLWPDNDFGWVYNGARGTTEGIITMWRSSAFTVCDQWSTSGALAIKGLWTEEKVSIILINDYASCINSEHQILWNILQEWISNQTEVLCCICGDFNTTLDPDEINGVSSYNDAKKRRQFNRFVSDAELVDLPLMRRKYTWYKDNGGSCSRIDRFLLSATVEKENWGPVPFKTVNWWLEQEEFCKLVESVWKNIRVDGWGGYVLKEKLKRLKIEIKTWKTKNGTMFSREIEDIEKQLSMLDGKQELDDWEEADTHNRRALQLDLEEIHLKRDRLLA
ncbi:hypothetical protein ACS0TY_017654 [Phlomoides rotata]